MTQESPEVYEWHIFESSSPEASPVVRRLMHVGPFASEEQCRALLATLKQTPGFCHANLEAHKRQKQRQKRIKVKLPVRVWRPATPAEVWPAHTVDITNSGARLWGLGERAKTGEVLEISCGRRQAVFRVLWAGMPGTSAEGQIGVECLGPEIKFWDLDLSEQTDDGSLLQEIAVARAVQSKFMPRVKPPLQTLDYAGNCIQAHSVGGDYYDFLDMGPGRVGFVLADVAGKGVAAALLMANLHGSIHSQGMQLSPQNLPRLLQAVNHHLYHHTETDRYASLFVGHYSDETRRLHYVNCGHSPPLLLRQGDDVERLTATATVLGLFEHWEGTVRETRVEAGNVLSIFTDGITETVGKGEEEFGEKRLLGAICKSRGLGAASILSNIEGAVEEFRANRVQQDDLTLVVARGK